MSRTIRVYLDFISPYAYVGWKRIFDLAARHGCRVEAVPVLFAGFLDVLGQKGPAEIPPKRIYTFKDAFRKAAAAGLPALTPPPSHPFNPLLALRVASLPMSDEQRRRIIDRFYEAVWAGGGGVESKDAVLSHLNALGLDAAALVEAAGQSEAKARLKAQTEAALKDGAFGVPSFVIDGELFWGVDSLEHLDRFLSGADPLPADLAQRWRSLSASAQRPAVARAAALASAPVPSAAPADPELFRRISALFEAAPFMRSIGSRVLSASAGVCESGLSVVENHRQQDGFVHAAVTAALADHTAGGAALTMAEPDQRVLTVEFKINLLRPARGESLRCRSSVLRPGRRLSICESEVWAQHAGSEKLVAKASVTLAITTAAEIGA